MRPQVGHIQFLNCLPLYHMLVKSGVVLEIDLYKDTPVELCNRLLSGRLDISPVPAIEYARHADDLLLLPKLTVSSSGRVMSIILASKVPLQKLDGEPVALTNTSATSQVLAKIILREKYKVKPSYFECPPDLPEMFREAEAALLIGDDALRVFAKPGKYYLYDLGEEWQKLTADKMVYAVWAVRRTYAQKHPRLVSKVFYAFQRSLDMSFEHLDQIAGDIARWETFSKKFLKDYFKTLKYEFGEDYQQGLLHYYRLAKKIDAIKRIPKLRFVDIV
jgi:chorismate dehydratase